MVRRVIQIDEEKCNGCGICAEACHEGAIGIVDGKAKLLRDDYCDCTEAGEHFFDFFRRFARKQHCLT